MRRIENPYLDRQRIDAAATERSQPRACSYSKIAASASASAAAMPSTGASPPAMRTILALCPRRSQPSLLTGVGALSLDPRDR